jgi:hypothetical protein
MSVKELTIPQNVILRPHQKELLKILIDNCLASGGYDRFLFNWHRRAGKDYTCFAFLCIMGAAKKGVYWHMFPQQNQAYKIVCLGLDENKNSWLDMVPSELIKKYPTKNDPNLYFKNGSIVMLLGIDKVKESNRGAGADGIVISEYAFSEYGGTTAIIEPILKANKGFLIVNSTPNGHNQFYHLREAALKMPNKWYVDERTIEDTKLLDWDKDIQPDIDAGVEGMDYDTAMKEYMCSFGEMSTGSFYGDLIEKLKQEGRMGPYTYDPNRTVDTYWDIGIDDMNVIWFCQNIGSRRILIDYHEDNSKPPSEYVKVLKNKGYTYGTHYMPHDAGHRKVQMYELLTTQGIYDRLLKDFNVSGKTKKVDKPHRKIDAINALRQIFHTIYVSDNVATPFKQIERLRRKYDGKSKCFSDVPIKGKEIHAADALAVMGMASAMKNHEYFLEGGKKLQARKAKTGLSIKW